MKRTLCFMALCCAILALAAGCSPPAAQPLPPPSPDGSSPFGVDQNINMTTIDNYLNRPDVCYRDVRMLFDPADYGSIGGEADLTRTIQGFQITPYPYIATLSPLPVSGAYSGSCLYTLGWSEDGSIRAATPNYAESALILEELFPKDRAIFFMCGGGGYAGMARDLLVHLGWDERLLYNIGANWSYTGEHVLELAVYAEEADGGKIYATWRADYAYIAFDKLHPIAP